jgi:hypothetical protein
MLIYDDEVVFCKTLKKNSSKSLPNPCARIGMSGQASD